MARAFLVLTFGHSGEMDRSLALDSAARSVGLPNEEQRNAAAQGERPEDRPEVCAIGDVGRDEANAQEDEGQRQAIDDVLRRVVLLRDQDTGDEDRQGLKAV